MLDVLSSHILMRRLVAATMMLSLSLLQHACLRKALWLQHSISGSYTQRFLFRLILIAIAEALAALKVAQAGQDDLNLKTTRPW